MCDLYGRKMGTKEYKGKLQDGYYKGFLIIRCEECGQVKAFCARKEIVFFRCDKCGHQTFLHDLKPLYMNCECGEKFRYKTNITDRILTRKCLSCDAPIDMELNKSGTAYVTIGSNWRR